MNIVPERIESYLASLTRADDEPVLLEMEELAKKNGFPIVGRLCGRFLELMARSIGAERLFELGSGYGYSAYWFSRATGPDGEIHLTDGNPDNEKLARGFLSRAGLDGPISYHVGVRFRRSPRSKASSTSSIATSTSTGIPTPGKHPARECA